MGSSIILLAHANNGAVAFGVGDGEQVIDALEEFAT